MVNPVRTAGFTLIELMITIVIVVLVLLVGMPFTRDWVDNNRQLQARSVLWEGIGYARARAMRNPGALPRNDTATELHWARDADGKLLEVRNSGGEALWAGRIHDSIGFSGIDDPEEEGDSCSLVAYNSRGIPSIPSTGNCGDEPSITIEVRGEDKGMPDVQMF